jgi:hypothetical protein
MRAELMLALQAIVFGLLVNELFIWQPWCIQRIARLAARLDADSPEEAEEIYAEYIDGISRLPGHLAGLAAALGLLFKVTLARRVRNGAIATFCAINVRIDLLRTAIMGEMRQSQAACAASTSEAHSTPWHTVWLQVVVVTTDRETEIFETRRIMAHESGIDYFRFAFGLRSVDPDVVPDVASSLDGLAVSVLAGGVLAAPEPCGSWGLAARIVFPQPLAAGEEHEFTTRTRVTKPFAPHYVFTPQYACERFRLVIRFNADRVPATIRMIENKVRPGRPDRRDHGRLLEPDSSGAVCVEFANLPLGVGFGIGWDPTQSRSTSVSRH